MKDTFYFSHDYNTRSDDKIKMLIRKHGMLGYGLFWAIVEDLYNNANAMRTDYDGIAYELRTDSEIIRSIINDFELFTINENYFGSLSVQRRLDERGNKSIKAKESAFARWNKNANALQTQCEGNAIKERKGKERKVNKEFIAPSLDDVKLYFKENNYKEETAIRFYQSYSVANWVDSKGNKVKNWKQKAINVWFKEENKVNLAIKSTFTPSPR